MKNEIYNENYFIYKGVSYGVGTKVVFTDNVYKNIYNAKAKNQPHTFIRGSNTGWKGFYWEDEASLRPKIYFNNISIYDPDNEIMEIVKPVYVELVPWQQNAWDNMIHKKVTPDVFGGCLLYVMAMIVGTIFVDKLLIWTFATVLFIIWLLNQYRT